MRKTAKEEQTQKGRTPDNPLRKRWKMGNTRSTKRSIQRKVENIIRKEDGEQ